MYTLIIGLLIFIDCQVGRPLNWQNKQPAMDCQSVIADTLTQSFILIVKCLHLSSKMQQISSIRENNHFCYYHRPQTTQYNNIISDLTRCLVIIPKWAGLAPWCCVNECFFVWLGGHVWKKGLRLPPRHLAPTVNSVQNGPIGLRSASSFTGSANMLDCSIFQGWGDWSLVG